MNTLDAITIIEGDAEADFDTVIEAWQALIEMGLVWRLQGSYGRMAHNLIPHPGNQDFDCGGWRCEHHWFSVKTDEQMTF